MKLNSNLIQRLLNKSSQSSSQYKVSALGFNNKGELLGTASNRPQYPRRYGGVHAEENLINQYKGNLKTIIICRTSAGSNKLLPIHPCRKCSKLADKYGVKIIPLLELL